MAKGKKTMSKWRPASMGAIKGKILGVPKQQLFWGAGGAGASLLVSYVAGSMLYPLEGPTFSPTLVGALVSAGAGYLILSASKGYKPTAMSWVAGALVPLAAKTVYDIFFVTPPPAQTPAPESTPAPVAVPV